MIKYDILQCIYTAPSEEKRSDDNSERGAMEMGCYGDIIVAKEESKKMALT